MALAIDASTPAIATNAVGSVRTVTTASFNPPPGSLLLIRWSANTSNTDLPNTPTITDNLGAHLSYTLLDFDSRNDSPQRAGQCATWWAVATAGGSMTVTVTAGNTVDPSEAAVHVTVLTGQHPTTPIGAHGKNRSSSAGSIAQTYTASADGGWGFLVVCDWDTLGPETAGSGCTLTNGGSADIPSQITYTFLRRTTADDVNGQSNSLNVTLPGTSTDLHWTWAEVLPAPAGGSPVQPPPPGLPPFLLAQLLQAAAPGPTAVTWDPGTQTDDTGLTDTAAFEQDKVVTDDSGLTDTSTLLLAKTLTQTDDVGLTDSVVFEQDKVVTDSTGLTDTAAIDQSKVVTDSTGLTDTSTLVLAKVVTQDDSVGLTDSAVIDQAKVATDTVGLTDAATLDQSKVVTDQVGLTDNATELVTRAVTQTDSAGLTDTQTYSNTRAVTDNVGLTDPTAFTVPATFTDTTGLTDTATAVLTAPILNPMRWSLDSTVVANPTDATTTGNPADATTHATGLTE